MISAIGSSSSSSSSSSAIVRVDKATSEFLIGPDWTLNINICDSINSNQWLAKDVVKAVKKRLLHKNPKVQLLSLTLLETIVKNCGDNVHFHIAERNILQDMVKIVKKKTDMHVRDKVLVLLQSWQEAFGGPGGKHPQYYWASEELRRAGVDFPKSSFETAPIFTPPVTHPTPTRPGYAFPSNSATRLDEAMAAEMENLSLSSLNSMSDVLGLLADMLQAVNPGDRLAVKDEVIVDLVERCRSNQKKLMQMLTTTGDDELLAQGLELNDSLQSVLAKHDAIASGSLLSTQSTNKNPPLKEMHDFSLRTPEVESPSPTRDAKPSEPVLAATPGQVEEEEEEEDDFAQLARRHSKAHPPIETSGGITSANNSNTIVSPGEPLDPVASNALVLRDAPAWPTKEQEIIDLLSITLSPSMPPETLQTPVSSTQNMYQEPAPSASQQNPYASQAYLGYQGQNFSGYVTPWARAQPQAQSQFHPQLQSAQLTQPQPQPQHQPWPQHQHQHQPLPQPQLQPQIQSHAQSPIEPRPKLSQEPQQSLLHPQHPPHQHSQSPLQPGLNQPKAQAELQPQPQQGSQIHHQFPPQPRPQSQYSGYLPPPWAATPGYYSNLNSSARQSYMHSTPQATASTLMPTQGPRPEQNVNFVPTTGSNGSAINGDALVRPNSKTTISAAGQKAFVPTYRLFEDLNVFGSGDQRFKSSSALPASNSQSMVGERK